MTLNELNDTLGMDDSPWSRLMISAVDVDDELEQAERGLRRYVGEVARGMGVGMASAWCELADRGSAYLALDERMPGRVGRDVALVWDDRRGWALGVETGSGEDMLILSWYGPQPLPAPHEVVRFAKRTLAGHRPLDTNPPAAQPDQVRTVRARLARYLPG